MTTTLLRRARHVALGAALTVGLATCATNPVTGRSELALVSESQEIQMGQQAAQEAAASIGLVQDQALQDYVQRIGTTLAKDSERPALPWTFRVADDPTPNAFALPGGYIFVTRGMLTHMSSEAELASVLGHEIGHVTARHSVQMMSRAQLAQLGLGIGMIFSETLRQFGDLAGAGMQLLFLRYGRDAERQADELGFRYALTHNYDVREMVSMFATLQRLGDASGQSPLPSWASSHPDPGERIAATQQRIAELSRTLDGLTVDRAQFLQRVEGLVYGANPRHGFFQGALFLHPDLRFRMEFPQGWKTQNLTNAVLGVSPQQDAAIQLTLAQGSATQAAQQFLGQQGITPAQTTRESINGIPAVVSYFEAQTQQGVIRGLATFLEYGGNTYSLLSYAPATNFANYDAAFRRTVSTFGPLTDQRALSIQPNRVRVVRLDQPQTLAQFNQSYPSVIPIEELAIINKVQSAGTVLPAGTLLKRIVGG